MSELEFALRLADIADRSTSAASRTAADVDRAVEAALVATVAAERPHDGFVGEEVGPARIGRPRWIVDGIDGTAAFRLGRPEWATLIALEADGHLVAAVATAPALRCRWWAARAEGAWTQSVDGGGAPTQLRVRQTSVLGDARVETWLSATASVRADLLADRLASRVATGGSLPWATPRPSAQRPSWGSGHPGGAILVAAGLLDGFVMTGGGPWDYAAPALIVEEAGGRFSDFDGGVALDIGTAIFSNGLIHDELLDALRPMS